jgi:hypothetical protein
VRYQLVLQFTANTTDNFDPLVYLKGKLIEALDNVAAIDGHDFGLSEFNIFILTNEPAIVFDRAHRVVRDQKLQDDMRAAYRESNGERYVILWPPTLTEFVVS